MLKAEAGACSGAEVALHPRVNPGSANLNGQLGNGASYNARLTGEGGRLNLFWLLAPPENPNKLEVLRRYLENKGIDLNERDLMIDSLLDWVEPNTGLHRLNAPPESDTYHPAHAMLTGVDELKQVAGWAEFTSTPGWDDDFTVNRYTNAIDMQWVSRDALLALPGLTPEIVDRFLQLRDGRDGITGTADDMQFKSVVDFQRTLGPGVAHVLQQLHDDLGLITFGNVNVYRVVSVGKTGNATRTVQIVFQKSNTGGVVGGGPTVISWKEF